MIVYTLHRTISPFRRVAAATPPPVDVPGGVEAPSAFADWPADDGASTGAARNPRRKATFALVAFGLIVVIVGGAMLLANRPATAGTPRAGHWMGKTLSFDVDDSGRIWNLVARGSIPTGSCTMRLSGPIAIEDGGFDPGVAGFALRGEFTDGSHARGTVKVTMCRSGSVYTAVLAPIEESWAAEYAGSDAAARSSPSAIAPAGSAGVAATPSQLETRPPKSLVPLPSVTTRVESFNLDARNKGVLRGLVAPGDRVVVRSSGRWCLGGTGDTAECGGPDGIRSARADETDVLLPGAKIGTLIVRVGDGEWVPVGAGTSFTATSAGAIAFQFNDRACCYDDNSGFVQVTFTVEYARS